jgi:uncharacterized protein with HEPN domain
VTEVDPRRDADRLADILHALERIESKTSLGRAAFDADEMIQVWVIHHLEIAGEATAGLSRALRDAYPDVRWGGPIGMRNRIVHGYFEVDSDLVWDVAVSELPDYGAQVRRVLEGVTGA